jgi:hypothetical protein
MTSSLVSLDEDANAVQNLPARVRYNLWQWQASIQSLVRVVRRTDNAVSVKNPVPKTFVVWSGFFRDTDRPFTAINVTCFWMVLDTTAVRIHMEQVVCVCVWTGTCLQPGYLLCKDHLGKDDNCIPVR